MFPISPSVSSVKYELINLLLLIQITLWISDIYCSHFQKVGLNQLNHETLLEHMKEFHSNRELAE